MSFSNYNTNSYLHLRKFSLVTNIAITPDLKERILELDMDLSSNLVDNIPESDKEVMGGDYADFGSYRTLSIKGFGNGKLSSRVIGTLHEEIFDVIEDMKNWFKVRKEFFAIPIYANPGNENIINKLIENGFRFQGSNTYWIKSLDDLGELQEVSAIKMADEELIERFADKILEANEVGEEQNMNHDYSTHPFRIWIRASHNFQNESCFLYYKDREAVGTGSVFILEDIGFIANGSTIPDYRGQKIQQQLLDYRLKYAASKGAKLAVVTTDVNSTSGRNMERMGFQKAYDVLYLVYRFDN